MVVLTGLELSTALSRSNKMIANPMHVNTHAQANHADQMAAVERTVRVRDWKNQWVC